MAEFSDGCRKALLLPGFFYRIGLIRIDEAKQIDAFLHPVVSEPQQQRICSEIESLFLGSVQDPSEMARPV
jgi:hypothetical protein